MYEEALERSPELAEHDTGPPALEA